MIKRQKIAIILILILSLSVSIYYGFLKAGFHEDEYYTYFSTNRSLGLYQPDRQWQDRQTILDEFTVKEGEGFNYGLVKLVQSWDVHPPFYYFIFHTICSLVPGVFTKWTGIITNLIAFVISFAVLYLLMKRLKVPFSVQLLILIFWGMNPQTISANIFVRMYAWLTTFVFLCALMHIRLIQDYKKYEPQGIREYLVKYLLPIMVVSYLGFLIQYFYLFFFASIGFAAFIWFLRKRDYARCFIYVVCCGISLALAVLTYPSSLSHMFGGYRGSDAAGGLFSLAGTGTRLTFFIGLLNTFVFAGGLIVFVLFLIIAIMALMIKNKKHQGLSIEATVLTVGTFGYFLLTAKSALLVGSASNRYEMPIYGLIILLLFWDLYYVIDAIGNKGYVYGFAVVILAFLLKGLLSDQNVLFLYPEDVEKVHYAKENCSEVAVVMFNPATPHNVWRLTDELIEYDEVFYMDEENLEDIIDEKVITAKKIILYVADDDYQYEAIQNLMDSNQTITNSKLLSMEDMWKTYELN